MRAGAGHGAGEEKEGLGLKMQVRGLSCGYAADKPVLERLSFSVSDHEICCILGPNGVGKTTLFKTLLRSLPPLAGEICMDGEDISRWSGRRTARAIAYAAQNHVPPFPYLVEDVVLLGRVASTGYFRQPSREDREIAEAAMEDMGISHLRERAYTDVSGGERQLVMLARAMAHEPQLMLLDEPTASLDYGNQIRVLEKICVLRDRGYAVVMTTHLPEHAFLCEASAVLLQRNAPVISGRAAEVLTEKNLYDAYGVRVSIVEHLGPDGRIQHMCSPVLNGKTEDRP